MTISEQASVDQGRSSPERNPSAASREAPADRGLGMKHIKPLLQARAPELARQLVPGGRVRGDIYQVPSPRRQGASATSFCIWVGSDDRAGGFKDWVSGESGDVFALIEFALANVNGPKEALAWAKQWLGLSGAAPAAVARVRAEAKAAGERAAREDEKAKARKRAYARSVWLEGAALTGKAGDHRQVPAWKYLTLARAIPMGKLLAIRPIGALRAGTQVEYIWPELRPGDSDGGEREAYLRARRPASGRSHHPALLATMSPVNGGKNAGLHRTFLARDGLGKAGVPSPKKMMGQISGCAIMLWRGETGLSASAAAAQGRRGPLVVCEGIEDALSIASVAPALRVWAVGSLAGLATLPWPDCASELIIFADNDWKPEAIAALDRAVARLDRLGPVRVARIEGHKDANDALKAGALNFN